MQWKAAISPHDDYKYADVCTTNRLKINANTIIFLVGAFVLETPRQNHF
jgi:hypothetical protein